MERNTKAKEYLQSRGLIADGGFWEDIANNMEIYKDQELSELKSKYDKLKEAFEDLLQSDADTKYSYSFGLNKKVGSEALKNKWKTKAGLI